MSQTTRDVHRIEKWKDTLQDYQNRKTDPARQNKLPWALKLVIVLTAILSVILFYVASRELVLQITTLGEDITLAQAEEEYNISKKYGAYTMHTKDNFDRDAYPLCLPEIVEASSEFTAKDGTVYAAENLFDGTIEKTWQESEENSEIRISFEDPQMVAAIGIWPGNQKSKEKFQNNSRPSRIIFYYVDGDGETYTQKVNLWDKSIEQILVFDEPVQIQSMVLDIEAVYEGAKYSNDMIAEIAIYGVNGDQEE